MSVNRTRPAEEVLYSASGSGTTRTVAEKFDEILDPKDFGATGDGVTNDTTSIQNALNSSAASTIALGPGTYLISGISVPANKELILSTGATLTLADGSDTDVVTLAGNGAVLKGPGTINGNAANQAVGTSSGVRAASLSDLLVDGVFVTNCEDRGIYITNSSQCTVQNCKVTLTGRMGIQGRALDTQSLDDFRVINCYVDRSDDAANDDGGIEITGDSAAVSVARPLVQNCTVIMHTTPTGSSVVGIEFFGNATAGPYNGHIESCSVVGSTIGISVAAGSNHCSVTNCTVRAADGIGIEIANSRDNTVAGNTVDCQSNTNDGIVCNNNAGPTLPTIRNTITGNTVREFLDRGILVIDTDSAYITITGNTLSSTDSNMIAIYALNSGGNVNCAGNVVDLQGGVGSERRGFSFNNSSNCTFIGNQVKNAQRPGQLVANNQAHTDFLITQNDFTNNTTDQTQIIEQGTGTLSNIHIFDNLPDANIENNVITVGTDAFTIQDAIDALPAVGGIVDARGLTGNQSIDAAISLDKPVELLLGVATFTVNVPTAFVLSDGASIKGMGPGDTTLFHGASAGATGDAMIENADFTNGNSNIEVSGLTIDGNKLGQSPISDVEGFRIQHSSDVAIHNVEVKDTLGPGIRLFHPKNRTSIHHNIVTNVGATGEATAGIDIQRSTTTNGPTDTLEVHSNYIDNSGSNAGGIGVAASNTATMRNIRIYDNTIIVGDGGGPSFTFGVEVFAGDSPESFVSDVHIFDNDIRGENDTNSFIAGISLAGRSLEFASVHGNSLKDCRGRGMEIVCGDVAIYGNAMEGCGPLAFDLLNISGSAKTFTGVTCTGNIIKNGSSSTASIYMINGGTHTGLGYVITGNTIRTPAGNGVNILGQWHDCKLEGNVVSDSSGAAGGSHAIVTGPNGGQNVTRIILSHNNIIDWTTGTGLRLNAEGADVEFTHFQNVSTPTNFTGSTDINEIQWSGTSLVVAASADNRIVVGPTATQIAGLLESLQGHFVSIPEQELKLDQSAVYPYDVLELTARTATGEIDFTMAINGTPIGGLENRTATFTETVFGATGAAALTTGDQLTIDFSGATGAPTDFSWTLSKRRNE